MKKTFYTILIIVSINLSLYSQSEKTYDVIKKEHNTIISTEKEYNLILISNSECGHSLIALEKIKQFTKKINIIIIDYGNTEKRKKLKLKYNYTFLNGNEINLGYQDFFPKLFLYDNNGNLIWEKEGWFNKNIKKINSKIKSH